MDIAVINKCVSLPLNYDIIFVDSMLGWLVRWLRMLGLSINYSPDFDDRYLVGVEGLVITRDKELFELRKGDSLLLLTMNHEHWLAVAMMVLNISPNMDAEKSLCPVCGSKLIKVGRDVVKDKVPPRVLSSHDVFWLCTNCGRVYWIGSHHIRINKTLNRARELMTNLIIKCINNSLVIQL